jgi:hypothetical protein
VVTITSVGPFVSPWARNIMESCDFRKPGQPIAHWHGAPVGVSCSTPLTTLLRTRTRGPSVCQLPGGMSLPMRYAPSCSIDAAGGRGGGGAVTVGVVALWTVGGSPAHPTSVAEAMINAANRSTASHRNRLPTRSRLEDVALPCLNNFLPTGTNPFDLAVVTARPARNRTRAPVVRTEERGRK